MLKYSREKMSLPKGPFETERLILRPLGFSHEPAIWEMFSDPEFVRYVPFGLATDRTAAREKFFDQIKAGERFKFHLGVEWKNPPKADDKTVGFAMFRPTEDGKKMEIGYCVVRRQWGKGLGTEITRVLVGEVAKKMATKKPDLSAKIHPANIGSIKVAEKCGFEVTSQVTEEEVPYLVLHWQG
ncbi:MAG: GNAT family N-acetyltransferase [Alphaproteobacteria bacterium]